MREFLCRFFCRLVPAHKRCPAMLVLLDRYRAALVAMHLNTGWHETGWKLLGECMKNLESFDPEAASHVRREVCLFRGTEAYSLLWNPKTGRECEN